MKIISTIIVVGIIILVLLGSNYHANSQTKKSYNEYYKKACNSPNITAETQNYLQITNETLNLCRNSGGCFTGCATACPPEQSYPLLKTYKYYTKSDACIAVCSVRCVCPLGKYLNVQGVCVE